MGYEAYSAKGYDDPKIREETGMIYYNETKEWGVLLWAIYYQRYDIVEHLVVGEKMPLKIFGRKSERDVFQSSYKNEKTEN